MNALTTGILLLAQGPEVSDPWAEVFWGFERDQRFALLIIVIGCSLGLILGTLGIVSSMLNSMHRRRLEADMKREMIERGMSADEIEKIIEAVTPPEDATQRWIASWCKKKPG